MADFTHLDALTDGLRREKLRLAEATCKNEITIRMVWIAQREREIAAEYRFLGVEPVADSEMTDDELLAELSA